MADIRLAFRTSPTSIDTLTLDAALSEKHETSIELTEHPVEEGADVADHVRKKPAVVTIEGLISNTPIGRAQTLRARYAAGAITDAGLAIVERTAIGSLGNAAIDTFEGNAPGYAEAAFAQLEALAASGKLVTVTTKRKVYENMKLVSVSCTDDAKTGDALRFTATLREVRLVKNKLVTIETDVPRAKGKAKEGQKPTKPAGAETKKKSILKKLADTDSGDRLLRAIGAR